MSRVTVVGGGLAGLIAAIESAERGATVELFEARESPGGRARSTEPPYIADWGPHALYPPNRLWSWLEQRDLLPPTAKPLRRGYRVVEHGRLKIFSLTYARALLAIRGEAPVDADFQTWAADRAGAATARAAASLLIAFTYDYDPGRLSARFCLERYRRVVAPNLRVRYVVGGWQRLVELLERKARSLGVAIHTNAHIRELPGPPVVIATDPRNAALLLGEVNYTTGRVALLDVAMRSKTMLPTVVFSLDQPMVAVRHSSVDRSLVPEGEDLVQLATGFPPNETIQDATARMEAFLDIGFKGWRERGTWRRSLSVEGAAGAVDLPGQTWRERPRIDYGGGVFLAGDWVAAPGHLSDVACASASEAARKAVAFSKKG